jgi:hypothetical protein
LIREVCFRMVLISWIVAPQASSTRAVACLSARLRPLSGSGSNADPPPERRQITRSCSPAPASSFADDMGAGLASIIRHGMAGLDQGNVFQGADVAVLDIDAAARHPVSQDILHGRRHGCGGFAGPHHVNMLKTGKIIFPLADSEARALKTADALDGNIGHDRFETGREYVNGMPAHPFIGSRYGIVEWHICLWGRIGILVRQTTGG